MLRRQLRAADGEIEARLDDLVLAFEIVAFFVDDQRARLRDDVLALLKRQVGVLLLDNLGLALGPPFDDAGALDERVLEKRVQDEEARIVILPDISDVVLLLLGDRHVSLGAPDEMDRMLLA